ncbi:hypothetical protein [Vibrio galatheae]|uniref:hypothetical protein n=1 Tax=Vibrio galatheae TaxID=579748 RepID=UPI0012EDA447|nr:hypothetical protein [Vibrio galatheae]
MIKESALIADTNIKLAVCAANQMLTEETSLIEVKSAEHEAKKISGFDGVGVKCLCGTGKYIV